MQQKYSVSQQDLDIARRLAGLRVQWGLSREDLSRKSGVEVSVITRVELGRLALRYRDGRVWFMHDPLYNRYPVNPLWMAFGEEPVQLRWYFFLPENDALGLRPNARFSEFANANRGLLSGIAKDPPELFLPEPWLQPFFRHLMRLEGFHQKAMQGVGDLRRVLSASAEKKDSPAALAVKKELERIAMDHLREASQASGVRLTIGKRGQVANIPLTENEKSAKIPRVVPQMESLLQTARDLVSDERGKKLALARFLEVSPSRVSDWLADEPKGVPDGPNTLRLLAWVQAERSAQKSPRKR